MFGKGHLSFRKLYHKLVFNVLPLVNTSVEVEAFNALEFHQSLQHGRGVDSGCFMRKKINLKNEGLEMCTSYSVKRQQAVVKDGNIVAVKRLALGAKVVDTTPPDTAFIGSMVHTEEVWQTFNEAVDPDIAPALNFCFGFKA
ncbi:hypothetical protein Tco_0885855 [Tanacetum coccineum]